MTFPIRTFQALKERNFRLFWTGQFISLIGTWMQSVAQSWLVLELTGSAFMLGLVTTLGTLPILLFSLPAGVIADRVDKRRLLITTQTIMMILALTLAVLASFHAVRVWHLLVLATLLGVVNAFDMPGRQAFVIEIIRREDLTNAIGLNSTAFNSARILGPALAGVLLGTLGAAACFYINGFSFIAVIVGLQMMNHRHTPPSTVSESITADILDGLRYVKSNREILTLMLLVGVFSIFGMPYAMLMPVFAQNVLHAGARGYSLLMTCTGIGALAGALTLATFGGLKRRGIITLASAVIFVLFAAVFSGSRNMAVSCGALVFIGFSMVTQAAGTNSLLQTLAPDHLRGRVMAVFTIMLLGLAPIGSFQAGVVAQNFGAPLAVLAGSAALAVAIAFVLIFRPEVKNL